MVRTLGIVGGGQLGRMLAQAAQRLGFKVTVLDPTPNSPAGQVADEQLVGDFKNPEDIRTLAKSADFITSEIESAHADTLQQLIDEGVIIHPSPKTLSIIKDKLRQKQFLSEAGIPVASFLEVDSSDDIVEAGKQFGYPLVVKARFDAYDGRGNAVVKNPDDIDQALGKLSGRQLYIEQWVPFAKELSVVVARGLDGSIATYPVVETIHQNNICHIVMAPAPVSLDIQQRAEQLAYNVMQQLQGVGVFAIEMFLTDDNQLVVNEIAPRVHNSGHHTIEANATSQFEQHIRAITGQELGSTELRVPAAVMINILGERHGAVQLTGLDAISGLSNTSVHIYGKIETRPERKMGHITVTADTIEEALEKAKIARSLITI